MSFLSSSQIAAQSPRVGQLSAAKYCLVCPIARSGSSMLASSCSYLDLHDEFASFSRVNSRVNCCIADKPLHQLLLRVQLQTSQPLSSTVIVVVLFIRLLMFINLSGLLSPLRKRLFLLRMICFFLLSAYYSKGHELSCTRFLNEMGLGTKQLIRLRGDPGPNARICFTFFNIVHVCSIVKRCGKSAVTGNTLQWELGKPLREIPTRDNR